MRTVIIDNDRGIVDLLVGMVKEHLPALDVVGTAYGVNEGIKTIGSLKPDLVFLDVEMDDGTGFDLVAGLQERNFHLIFITAHSKYAIQAIKISALDYLLKPINLEELKSAVDRIASKSKLESGKVELQNLLAFLDENNRSKKIVLRSAESINLVNISDILWCAADGSYTKFRILGQPDLLVSGHLKEYEELLIGHKFYRPHNSYLLNLDHVIRFEKSEGGKIIMTDGSMLPVSTRKKEQLIKIITAPR